MNGFSSSQLQIAESTAWENAHSTAPNDIETQCLLEYLDSSLEDLARGKKVRTIDGIPESRSDFIFDFAHYTFGIDRQPSPTFVEDHVFVVKVAMQEPAVFLRPAKSSGRYPELPPQDLLELFCPRFGGSDRIREPSPPL